MVFYQWTPNSKHFDDKPWCPLSMYVSLYFRFVSQRFFTNVLLTVKMLAVSSCTFSTFHFANVQSLQPNKSNHVTPSYCRCVPSIKQFIATTSSRGIQYCVYSECYVIMHGNTPYQQQVSNTWCMLRELQQLYCSAIVPFVEFVSVKLVFNADGFQHRAFTVIRHLKCTHIAALSK
jgi:hypothetical protein